MLGKKPGHEIRFGIGLLCCADVRGSRVLLVPNVCSSRLERGNEAAGLLHGHRLIGVSVKHADWYVLLEQGGDFFRLTELR